MGKNERSRSNSGRLTDLTPEVANEISSHVRRGNSFRTSCRLAQIPLSTANVWLRKGRDSEREIYEQFILSVEKAAAERENELMENVSALMSSDDQSVALKATISELTRHIRNENEIIPGSEGTDKTSKKASSRIADIISRSKGGGE